MVECRRISDASPGAVPPVHEAIEDGNSGFWRAGDGQGGIEPTEGFGEPDASRLAKS
jgi:hypothetical protein